MTSTFWGGSAWGGNSSGGLPNGYIFKVNQDTGDLELWKTDESPEVRITRQNVGMFDVNGSIRTLLNTLYLENSHSISASGQNVVFKNLTTGVSYVPSGWDGHQNEGQDILRNFVQSPDNLVPNFNLYGDVDYTNTKPLDYDVVVPFAFNIYKIQYRLAQDFQGKATLTIRNSVGNVTYRQTETFDLVDRDLITFGGTYFAMLTGDEFNVKVTDENGDVLVGYQADTDTRYPFMMYDIRTFRLIQQLAGVQYITDQESSIPLYNRHYFVDSQNEATYNIDKDVTRVRITDSNQTFKDKNVTLNFVGGVEEQQLATRAFTYKNLTKLTIKDFSAKNLTVGAQPFLSFTTGVPNTQNSICYFVSDDYSPSAKVIGFTVNGHNMTYDGTIQAYNQSMPEESSDLTIVFDRDKATTTYHGVTTERTVAWSPTIDDGWRFKSLKSNVGYTSVIAEYEDGDIFTIDPVYGTATAYLGTNKDDIEFYKQDDVWHWHNYRNSTGGTL